MRKIIEIGTGYTSIPAMVGAATEIVVEELTKSFLKQGEDVVILDIEDRNRKPTDLPIIGIKLPLLENLKTVNLGILHKIKRVAYSILLAKRLRRMIKVNSDKELILHFHNQYNLFFFLKLTPVKLQSKVKIIYTNHSYIWSQPWDLISNDIKKRYFQEVYAMKHADRVYVLNQQTFENVVDYAGCISSKVRIVPNGVNTEVYQPLTKSNEDLLQLQSKLSKKNAPFFLNIGSVCPRKNQLGILENIRCFLQSNPDSKFLYAGGIVDNEYFGKLKEYVVEHNLTDQVVYLGELAPGNSLNLYYNLADYLLFCSLSEGFSLVVLEALSAGLPVVLSDNLTNELLNTPQNGVIHIKDEKSLPDIMNQLTGAAFREDNSKYAANFIRENLDWSCISKQILSDIIKE